MASADAGEVDALADGLLSVLRPAVEEVDARVEAVRESQVELREYIDKLSRELHRLSDLQRSPVNLDSYIQNLANSRHRILLVNNILESVQERLNRLHHLVSKETARRKAMLGAAHLS
ncbi:SNARE-associated protein Snapin-like [Corticium candelabrum]|uniref:SNARE-associated protein Snapin-like n=1 Tax=Corticium candelabrum TaxID=121492 RepID=UPI002E263342|nr:SNARE-associated protein Snapin-like [Corticium candelabrum]